MPIGFILIAALGLILIVVGLVCAFRSDDKKRRNFFFEMAAAGAITCGSALFTGSVSAQSTAKIQASVERRLSEARYAANQSMYANFNDALIDFNNATDQLENLGTKMQNQLTAVQLQVQNNRGVTIGDEFYTDIQTATAAQVALFKQQGKYQRLQAIENDVQFMNNRIAENISDADSHTLSSVTHRTACAHKWFRLLRHPLTNPAAQRKAFTDCVAQMQDNPPA